MIYRPQTSVEVEQSYAKIVSIICLLEEKY